ncbi:MAG TPA: hypothetical protein VI258_06140 [Rhodanobacteraceae bacterium]
MLLLGARDVAAAIPAGERDALIALYTSTHGEAWMDNANWCAGTCPASGAPVFNDPGTECTWYGITCDGAGAHVTSIVLFRNHMIGPLPAALAALTGLEVVDLDNDGLLGPLPDLTGLSALQVFDVHQNDIDGPMPPLAGLTSLETVRVFGNRLSGSLPALAGLTQLTTFLAYSNDFSGALPSFDGLAALSEFNVEHNHLTGSIPDLSSLVSLGAFRVGDNRLSGSVPPFPGDVGGPSSSSLCPNPLDTTPGPNDAGWDAQTGHTPWWATPYANNVCDDVFTDAFDAPSARQAAD